MRTDTSRHDAAAHEEARAEALRDSDALAGWLCENASARPAEWQPVLRDKTAADLAGWSTGDLIALLFDAGQPARTTLAARNALADRYCAQPNIAAYIDVRAAHEALRMVEAERFPEAA